MKEERYYLALDQYDKNIMLNALNTLRSEQVKSGRPTEPVNDLILKVSKAPNRKIRVQAYECNEDR